MSPHFPAPFNEPASLLVPALVAELAPNLAPIPAPNAPALVAPITEPAAVPANPPTFCPAFSVFDAPGVYSLNDFLGVTSFSTLGPLSAVSLTSSSIPSYPDLATSIGTVTKFNGLAIALTTP